LDIYSGDIPSTYELDKDIDTDENDLGNLWIYPLIKNKIK
jgi:hypothetical protein